MTLIKELGLVACLALLLTGYSITNAQVNQLDPTQVYTTNNIVNSSTSPTNTTGTWQNIGLWNQGLPCWGPGGPVYCGPQPYFNNGTFNFSYGTTDVYQVANIANALPNTGTGLRVNGFNFGFTAKNGNGWDDGRQDYLVAYVNIYGSDGKLAQGYDYGNYTNQKYSWTTFNFSETFPTPYATKDLSTVRYGFVGRDNNFWAGPYGPEIYNVNFSLKYSVDTCFIDVTSSPNCPGYLDAILKLTPKATNETTPTTNTATVTSTPSISTTTSIQSTTDVASPPAVTSQSSSSTISTPTVSSSTTSTTVTPTATNPQPKVGEVTVSGSPAKTTMSTSQILSIVRNEQTRIGNLEIGTAQQAVEQAQAASDKAQKDSLSISSATVNQSQAASQSIASMFSSNPSQSTNSNNNAMTNNSNNSMVNSIPKYTGVDPIRSPEVTSTQVSRQQNMYSLTSSSFLPQPGINVALVAPQVTFSINKSDNKSQEEEQQIKYEGIKFTGNNPIMNIINATPVTQQNTDTQTTTTSVNNKVKDNDIAGGVSLELIAKQPMGFEKYSSMLPDVAFYAPKEIYRNQRVIDNARAQRLLSGSSDRLHQEMVDSQYNKK